MKKIEIKTTQKSYPVFLGDSVLESITGLIEKLDLYKNIFVVVDENVLNKHKEYVFGAFKEYKQKINFYKLQPGEHSKSIEGISGIFSELINKNFGRDTLLIAIGGGVTGDLAGFAASAYMRGIQVIHVPTTLLACIDSSIGGKTGINFNKLKNIIGAFYQPEFVLIDLNFLETLPKEEINSGAGELVKNAFLTNEAFYNFINKNFSEVFSFNKQVLNKVIYESVLFKGSVVEKDEKEGGLRKILNLGHTFAHAFESKADYTIKHGPAVAAGIIAALYLSNITGLLSDQKLKTFLQLPLKIEFPGNFKINDFHSIITFMYGDKKNREGNIKFILLSDIGKIITDVTVEEVKIYSALEMTSKLINNIDFLERKTVGLRGH